MRSFKAIWFIFFLSALPLVLLGFFSMKSLNDVKGHERGLAVRAAKRTYEMTNYHLDHLLEDYFHLRIDQLVYAHMMGQESFETVLRNVYLTSALLDFPQFIPEYELLESNITVDQSGPLYDFSDPEVEASIHFWDEKVVLALRQSMVEKAREKFQYDPDTQSFSVTSYVEKPGHEAFQSAFHWIEIDVPEEKGHSRDESGRHVKDVAYEISPGHYSFLVMTFVLPGDGELSMGIFGAVVPCELLAQELLIPGIGEREISLVDIQSERILPSISPAPPTSPDAPVLFSSTVLGENSPWRLQVQAGPEQLYLWESLALQQSPALFFASLLAFITGSLLLISSLRKQIEGAALRRDLLGNLSHEFKTPLSLIMLYTETIEQGRVKDEKEMHRFLGVIGKEAARLTHMIDNVMDVQSIEEGRRNYIYAMVRPDKIVRTTVENYRFQLTEEGFSLRLDIDEGLPALQMDEEAMAQALINLLDNASKYSENVKKIAVGCRLHENEVHISIQDHGIGIPASDRKKIFEKYYRVERGLIQNHRGSGLGLAVVQHIVQAHGGSIDIDSTPAKGSTFTIRLPLSFQPENSQPRTGGS